MKRSGFPYFLVTGLAIGLFAGLLYGWLIDPVRLENIAPAFLRADAREEYRVLAARAFQASSDAGRAAARVALLGDEDPVKVLSAQAQRSLAEGGQAQEARLLAQLAGALRPSEAATGASPIAGGSTPAASSDSTAAGSDSTAAGSDGTAAGSTQPATATADQTLAVIAPTLEKTPAGSSSTLQASPAFTPRPPATPTATLSPPLVLKDRRVLCDQNLTAPLIQILVQDSAGKPVPGVRVVVTWKGGEDFFFTGLKPEIDPGYADFEMTPGTVYSLRPGESGEEASRISTPDCPSKDGQPAAGAVRLIYSQP